MHPILFNFWQKSIFKQEKTGLIAKIQDTWKWKGKAKQAETELEAEKKAHSEDIARLNKILAETKKTAEIAEKRANKAEFRESNLREENNKLYQENKRLSVVARHWKDQYDEAAGRSQGKGRTR